MSYLGTKVRELREQQGLLLRQLASHLNMDTALLSKIELGQRKAQKEQIVKIAKILKTHKDELIILWMADKVEDVLKDEPLAKQVLRKVLKCRK